MSGVRSYALRVGLIGVIDAVVLSDILGRLASILPPGPGQVTLRLLYRAGAVAGVPPGWAACPLTEALGGDATTVIVRNVDVLVAASEPAGPLAEPVAAALLLGVPVLCLSPRPLRLLTDRFWMLIHSPALVGDPAFSALRDHLAALLTPPSGPVPAALRQFEAGMRLSDRAVWRTHRAALNLLARTPRHATREPAPALGWWSPAYATADALANAYADRYRSSYTVVLVLAALALIVAVLGLRTAHHWPVAITEALCLAGIVALVRANMRLDWRSRMIQCRLLAELCRKQAALAFVGRSLPAAGIAGLTRAGGLDWIGWRFAALVRAAPLPTSTAGDDSSAAARDASAAVLLQGQRSYHAARVALGRQREAALVLAGQVVFGCTVLFVLVKLGLLLAGQERGAEWAGLAAALLPAIAAAVFGFRAYAELELLVQHSERLVGVIEDAEASLARIDPAIAGAARAIGDVLEEAAVAMLADVGGWIQISRVKAVEAG